VRIPLLFEKMDIIRQPWIDTYKKYRNNYRSEGEDRAFKAFTGVPMAVAEKIFLDYRNFVFLPSRDILLMVLHYLKAYPTEDEGTDLFHFGSRNTYRKKLWTALYYLEAVMADPDLEDRIEDFIQLAPIPIFSRVLMIIDGTQCPIACPSGIDDDKYTRMAYKGRSKDNTRSSYNLNYTVGVHVKSGKIIYVGGPHEGATHDIECVRREGLIGTILSYDPYELILADKGYVGEPIFLTPHKKIVGQVLTPQQIAENRIIASVRQLIECTLHRLNIFGILGTCRKFRLNHEIEKHESIFKLCCKITNICLERNPVWHKINFYLEY
jgi:hypothetical protein